MGPVPVTISSERPSPGRSAVPDTSVFRVGRDTNRLWNFFCDLCAWEQHQLSSAFTAAIHGVDHYASHHA